MDFTHERQQPSKKDYLLDDREAALKYAVRLLVFTSNIPAADVKWVQFITADGRSQY